MIAFNSVSKSFGDRSVLKNVSFKISQGEKLFLLGRSGSGKSVTLKLLVGILRPDSGQIQVETDSLPSDDEAVLSKIRRNCSLVFQLPTLIDSRSLFENVSLGIRELPLKDKINRVSAALEEVGLGALASNSSNVYPPHLSYGEQKRVSLARTLCVDPDYILYDEPTTGMDPVTARMIHKLISKIGNRKTSLVVSHDMRNALETADRILLIDSGEIQDSGTPSELLKSQHPLTREFLSGIKNV
jgi:phospholipid/cholesterol/gamma-HCH transport system ATP-binding protein